MFDGHLGSRAAMPRHNAIKGILIGSPISLALWVGIVWAIYAVAKP